MATVIAELEFASVSKVTVGTIAHVARTPILEMLKDCVKKKSHVQTHAQVEEYATLHLEFATVGESELGKTAPYLFAAVLMKIV